MGRGKPYLLLNEFYHPHLDGTIQLCTLACCAWVRCECVDKVHEIVQHEHRTVPCGGGVVLQQLKLCFGFSWELTPANWWAGQATLGFRPHLAGSGWAGFERLSHWADPALPFAHWHSTTLYSYTVIYSHSKNCPNVWLFWKDWPIKNAINYIIIWK
jgi:hypothetical protein